MGSGCSPPQLAANRENVCLTHVFPNLSIMAIEGVAGPLDVVDMESNNNGTQGHRVLSSSHQHWSDDEVAESNDVYREYDVKQENEVYDHQVSMLKTHRRVTCYVCIYAYVHMCMQARTHS